MKERGTDSAECPGMGDLERLRGKLCRELARSELDAALHTARDSRRLGRVPPSDAFRLIAAHAKVLQPLVDQLIARPQRLGLRIAHGVGRIYSGFRHAIADRVHGTERSYRDTLLGLHHSVHLAVLLREVALRLDDHPLLHVAEEIITERQALVGHAVQMLCWFADRPHSALASGPQLLAARTRATVKERARERLPQPRYGDRRSRSVRLP
jgi:hypothetical protein